MRLPRYRGPSGNCDSPESKDEKYWLFEKMVLIGKKHWEGREGCMRYAGPKEIKTG